MRLILGLVFVIMLMYDDAVLFKALHGYLLKVFS
jgi:hypothetical protein